MGASLPVPLTLQRYRRFPVVPWGDENRGLLMISRGFGRFATVATIALALTGCGKPDVYPISLREAYTRLHVVEIPSSGDGPFFRLNTAVSGNGADEVVWAASGSMAAHTCRMALTKIEAESTHVTVTCDGGSAGSGAAAGMEHNMVRNRVIEMVDATLTGRAFSPDRAGGSTASRWPGDGVDGSIGTAAVTAIKMDADTRKDLREMAEEDREREAQRLAENPDAAQGSDPGGSE
jgi:hypothetical protein